MQRGLSMTLEEAEALKKSFMKSLLVSLPKNGKTAAR